jgi:hypothetical protein
MVEHIAAEDRLLEVIDETERIARSAGHDDAPATGEHWHWVHGYRHCSKYMLPVDMTVNEYLGEDVEDGGAVDLTSVEEYRWLPYPGRVAGASPHWVVHVDEAGQEVGPARHIARHDPAAIIRRCEADRQMIRLHATTDAGECGICMDGRKGFCSTMLLLFSAYGVEV